MRVEEALDIVKNTIGTPCHLSLEGGSLRFYATPLVNNLPGPDEIEFIRVAIADTGFVLSEFWAASSLSPIDLRSGKVEEKLDGPDEDPENWNLSVCFTFTPGYEGKVALVGTVKGEDSNS